MNNNLPEVNYMAPFTAIITYFVHRETRIRSSTRADSFGSSKHKESHDTQQPNWQQWQARGL